MKRIFRRILTPLCLALLCTSAPAFADSPVYTDLTEACRDVRASVYEHQTHIEFSLTPDAVAGRPQYVIRDILTDVLEGYIDYTILFSQQEQLLDITIDGTMRPALNILRAWKTGDRSALTQDESRCMDIALDIAQECLRSAKSIPEIELAINNAICRRIAGYTGNPHPAFGTKEYMRTYSCIGALLDGETFCMGYAEVFYLIGRMAGLDVEMQYGFSDSSSNAKHAWNIVRIGSKVYALDSCWSDISGDIFELTAPDYRYFNTGLDLMPQGRRAHPEAQIAAVSETTDLNHSAFGEGKGGVLAATLEEAIDYGIARHNAGEPYAHIFIPDQTISLSEVNDAMKARVKSENITTVWGRMTHSFAGGTYVIFRWVLE